MLSGAYCWLAFSVQVLTNRHRPSNCNDRDLSGSRLGQQIDSIDSRLALRYASRPHGPMGLLDRKEAYLGTPAHQQYYTDI